MGLLGDEAQVEARFGHVKSHFDLFWDSVSVGAR
jgi:hypothetical protein